MSSKSIVLVVGAGLLTMVLRMGGEAERAELPAPPGPVAPTRERGGQTLNVPGRAVVRELPLARLDPAVGRRAVAVRPTGGAPRPATVARSSAGRRSTLRASEGRRVEALHRKFSQHPDQIRGAVDELILARVRGRQAALTIAVLGILGGREAEQGLIRLAEAPELATAERQTAIHALGSLPEPGEEALAALGRLSVAPGPLRDFSLHALGRLARTLGDSGQPQRATDIGAHLAQQLAQAPSADRKRAILRAIGDAGLAMHLPVVLEQLSASRPLDRKTALRALRHMTGSRVSESLLDRFERDTDPEVRVTAAQLLIARKQPSELAALCRVLPDRVAGERRRVVATLRMLSAADPELRGMLQEIANRRADPHSSAMARQALGAAAGR